MSAGATGWGAGLAVVAAALALTGCEADGEPDAAAGGDVERAVAALVEAHEAIEAFDADVDDAPARAADDWPEVERAVDEAVGRTADVDALAPRQRSALVGFRRGLQLARDAYADVAAAAADGDDAAVEEALATARRRLDALDNLRDGLPSSTSRSAHREADRAPPSGAAP